MSDMSKKMRSPVSYTSVVSVGWPTLTWIENWPRSFRPETRTYRRPRRNYSIRPTHILEHKHHYLQCSWDNLLHLHFHRRSTQYLHIRLGLMKAAVVPRRRPPLLRPHISACARPFEDSVCAAPGHQTIDQIYTSISGESRWYVIEMEEVVAAPLAVPPWRRRPRYRSSLLLGAPASPQAGTCMISTQDNVIK